jgi:hypothetical protein
MLGRYYVDSLEELPITDGAIEALRWGCTS